MIDVAELSDLLEESIERATSVRVSVSECQYRCCGGGWQTRAGAAQQYTGRILSFNVETFLLQCENPLGKPAEVIADFEHLLAATLVD